MYSDKGIVNNFPHIAWLEVGITKPSRGKEVIRDDQFIEVVISTRGYALSMLQY